MYNQRKTGCLGASFQALDHQNSVRGGRKKKCMVVGNKSEPGVSVLGNVSYGFISVLYQLVLRLF